MGHTRRGKHGFTGAVPLLVALLLPGANAWAKMPATITLATPPPVAAVAATLPTGQVLLAGGYDRGGDPEDGYLSNAELFDPTADTVTSLTGPGQALTEARAEGIAAPLPSGQVLIAGGQGDGEYALLSAELFNPATDTFTKLTGADQSLTQRRVRATAAPLPSGQVLITGGDTRSAAFSAELFNPATDTFGRLTGPGRSPTEEREEAVAAPLPSGEVLIAGGLGSKSSLTSAELFDPATDTFSKLTGPEEALSMPRRNAVAALLSSGQVLITGGEAGGPAPQPGAELFNPATDTFTRLEGAGQAPIEPREKAIAASLPSGQVLIAGGDSKGSGHLPSMELFSPAADTFATLKAGFTLGEVIPESRKVHGIGEPTELDVYASSGIAPTLTSETPSVCDVSQQARFAQPPGYESIGMRFKSAGVCTVLASVEASGEYEAAQAPLSFTVSKRTMTVTITAANSTARVGESRKLEAEVLSRWDPLHVSSATPTVCSLSLTRHEPHGGGRIIEIVHFNAAGACRIVAHVNETSEVTSAEASKSFTVRTTRPRNRIQTRIEGQRD